MILAIDTNKVKMHEASTRQSAYAFLCIAMGLVPAFLTIIGIVPKGQLILSGVFLFLGGLLGWISESKTTLLESNGSGSIQYRRHFGTKQWTRHLGPGDIMRIDYVVGRNMGNSSRLESIYLALKNNEQIGIGQRLGERETYLQRDKVPLSVEAAEIARFLKLPLNIIDMLNVRNSVKNAFIPKDKMGGALQRPTQEELDNDKGQ